MKQKLIDQLLHKAGARFGAEGTDYSGFTSSKFAELIVRECAEVCHKLAEDSDRYVVHDGDTCAEQIKQHFGVEK
jgi:hypothetical protein